jgi:hypothetical protein
MALPDANNATARIVDVKMVFMAGSPVREQNYRAMLAYVE